MKLLNYDTKTLLLQNVRCVTEATPSQYTESQYRILRRLVKQKKITKPFFDLVLLELYNLTDWHELNYQEMYSLIHFLTYYNYSKEEKRYDE